MVKYVKKKRGEKYQVNEDGRNEARIEKWKEMNAEGKGKKKQRTQNLRAFWKERKEEKYSKWIEMEEMN